MKPNISRIFAWMLGFTFVQPNLRVFVFSGVLSVNQDREIDRELISMNRRLTRLKDSQVTDRELKESFGRVYDDIDDLEAHIGRRFDVLEQRFDRLETEVRDLRVDLGGKMDAILRQITGMNS